MRFPTHDWQFYVATGIALLALLWLLRRFIPGVRKRRRRRGRPATLTIEGRQVDR